MKILIIHPSFTERGGAERKVLLLVNFLKEKQHSVDLICFNKDIENSFKELAQDIKIKVIRPNPISLLVYLVQLILFSPPYDVGIASNYPSNLLIGFLKYVNKAKSTIWICNEVHNSLHAKLKLKHYLSIPFERLIVRSFDRVIANSKNTENEIAKHFGTKAITIYPGVSFQTLKNTPERKEVLFCITRLQHGKNIAFLKNILKSTEKMIYLAGDGPLRSTVQAMSKENKNLFVLGRISEKDKWYYYSVAQAVLFLPLNEPFGVTNIEAIYSGAPVVSFNSGGPKEIIINNKNGFLCDNASDYLEAINHINKIKFNKRYFKTYIQQNFSLKAMLKGFQKQIYEVSFSKKN